MANVPDTEPHYEDDRHESEDLAYCQVCLDVYTVTNERMACGHTLEEGDAVT